MFCQGYQALTAQKVTSSSRLKMGEKQQCASTVTRECAQIAATSYAVSQKDLKAPKPGSCELYEYTKNKEWALPPPILVRMQRHCLRLSDFNINFIRDSFLNNMKNQKSFFDYGKIFLLFIIIYQYLGQARTLLHSF